MPERLVNELSLNMSCCWFDRRLNWPCLRRRTTRQLGLKKLYVNIVFLVLMNQQAKLSQMNRESLMDFNVATL